jgi:hypothetical protein
MKVAEIAVTPVLAKSDTVELNKVCDAASCFLRASPLSIQG